jgi:dethiobiotin synthetase
MSFKKKNQNPAGIFVTGTDTGVGKTFVSTNILRTLIKRGIQPGVMKPVETGCSEKEGRLVPEDALTLKKAASLDETLRLINPYALKYPLAPLVAAHLEGVEIDQSVILRAFSELREKYEFMLVEGAGGLMVPLTETYLMAHLAKEIALPLIVVARPSLGTINHTSLTVAAARSCSCDIAGIVINYVVDYEEGLAEKTNPKVMEKLCYVPVVGIVPFFKDDTAQLQEVFEKIVSRILD